MTGSERFPVKDKSTTSTECGTEAEEIKGIDAGDEDEKDDKDEFDMEDDSIFTSGSDGLTG